jgi:hypothetical protein
MEKVILELTNSLDKSTLEDAERMLRSFYRTIEPRYRRKWFNPERISWEIYAEKEKIGFYVVVPKRLHGLIKSRITDAYPQVEIKEAQVDHATKFTKPFTARMDLHKHYMFATKMKADDTPLNSVLNSMSKLEEDERMMLQISILPINDTWHGKAYRHYRNLLFNGKKPSKLVAKSILSRGVLYSVKSIFDLIGFIYGIFVPMGHDKGKNTPIERAELKGTQSKIALPGFNVSIRMAVESKDQNAMSTRLSELTNSFIETDADNEWRRSSRKTDNPKILEEIIERKVDILTNNKVTTSELSPLIRLANRNVYVPELTRRLLKTLPIPKGLEKGVFLGKGIYHSNEFDLFNPTDHVDSLVHPWMITGAMGGGKTTLITNMMLARATSGYGVIMLDTQGDMSKDFLSQLPPSEWHRVVWLNFGDLDYPPAIDTLETIPVSDPKYQKFVTQFAKNELISLFKAMYEKNFGPQTEYIVRNIVTATVELGQSSFIEIFRMLVDDNYREEITSKIRFKNPMCWMFWNNFQTNFSPQQKTKMMMPSINKIGAFLDDPMVRNITCQGLGAQNYSFRQLMDEGKIVVVTIPKGKLIGSWSLIGKLIVGKIWLAALSREDTDIGKRKPCFLFLDEAEDLIEDNENFGIMLSQSRKYRLGLVFGFQYLNQIKRANRGVYDALIGNKPSIVALKIGDKDAETYEDIFSGYYAKEDMDFPDLHGIAKLNIRGVYSTPFTLRIPYDYHTRDNNEWKKTCFDGAIEAIQDNSRNLYAKPVEEVEEIAMKAYQDILENIALDDQVDELNHEMEDASDEFLSKLKAL